MVWWDERCVLLASAFEPAASDTALLRAVVDVDCEYLRGVLLDAFRRRPRWSVQQPPEEPADECSAEAVFTWAEYERLDWSRVLAGDLYASAYCVRKGLIRKSNFAYLCKKHVSKRPASCLATGVPETHLFEFFDAEYIEEALADVPEVRDMKSDGSEWWILKPSITNQANGILVFNRLETLTDHLQTEGVDEVREWVLQRYIHDPLLVDGRKFHLRVYALAVGALRVYVFRDVLTLFSLMPYCDDPSHVAAHLTNTCRQAPADAQQEAACVGLLSTLPDKLAAEGMLSLEEARQRCATVFSDAQALVGEAFAAVSAELSFMPLATAFELFGFDLLVDASWKVWLLEANAEPDFVQTGSMLKCVVENVIEGTMQVTLDEWFPRGVPKKCTPGPILVFEKDDPRAHGGSGMRLQ